MFTTKDELLPIFKDLLKKNPYSYIMEEWKDATLDPEDECWIYSCGGNIVGFSCVVYNKGRYAYLARCRCQVYQDGSASWEDVVREFGGDEKKCREYISRHASKRTKKGISLRSILDAEDDIIGNSGGTTKYRVSDIRSEYNYCELINDVAFSLEYELVYKDFVFRYTEKKPLPLKIKYLVERDMVRIYNPIQLSLADILKKLLVEDNADVYDPHSIGFNSSSRKEKVKVPDIKTVIDELNMKSTEVTLKAKIIRNDMPLGDERRNIDEITIYPDVLEYPIYTKLKACNNELTIFFDLPIEVSMKVKKKKEEKKKNENKFIASCKYLLDEYIIPFYDEYDEYIIKIGIALAIILALSLGIGGVVKHIKKSESIAASQNQGPFEVEVIVSLRGSKINKFLSAEYELYIDDIPRGELEDVGYEYTYTGKLKSGKHTIYVLSGIHKSKKYKFVVDEDNTEFEFSCEAGTFGPKLKRVG